MHKHAYFRNPWDFLDGFIVIVSIVNLTATKVTVLKGLRAIRPVRVVARFSSMKIILKVGSRISALASHALPPFLVLIGPCLVLRRFRRRW